MCDYLRAITINKAKQKLPFELVGFFIASFVAPWGMCRVRMRKLAYKFMCRNTTFRGGKCGIPVEDGQDLSPGAHGYTELLGSSKLQLGRV